MGEFAAEVGQARAALWFDDALKVIPFMAVHTNQAGTDLDDFHFLHRPAALISGGLQVDD